MSGSSRSVSAYNKGRAFARAYNWKTIVLLLVLLALVIKAGLIGWHVYRLASSGLHLRALARDPGALLNPEGPARLKADLAGVEGALRGLRSQLGFLLKPSWLPWRAGRENLMAANVVMAAGIGLAHAGQDASQGLQAVVDALQMQGTTAGGSPSEALCEGLLKARPDLGTAEQQVARVSEDISALQAGRLWSPLSRGVDLLQRYLPLGRAALGAAVAAPTLLGSDEPVDYLILAQNSDELRATGGFISTIGVATFDRSKLAQLSMKDSYTYDRFTVDRPDAPLPMRRHMGIDLWTTRDGNWSPDFPKAAQDVEQLYHLENTGDIRGVIAFDMFAVQEMVRAVGPLDIPEYNDRVDGENVLDKMRAFWSTPSPGEWLEHRKDFVDVMASAVMDRLQSPGQLGQMGTLARMLKRLMDERHMQMYFEEPAAQGLLAAGGWDGRLVTATAGDYWLALDTNMGYNKVNTNVEKQMEYEVVLGQVGRPAATLTMTYTNHSRPQTECVQYPAGRLRTYDLWANDCYWDYLRLYVPLGSELLSSEGITETEVLPDEAGRTVWGAMLVVPAAASRAVRLRYRLPDFETGRYLLYVQKQAGTEAVPLLVRVVVPEDSRLGSTSPLPARVTGNVVVYEWDLREDRRLSLSLR